MAENIDLLFTVADASKSDILNTFKALQTTINSSYADIKYKVDPSAKAEIEALTAAMRNLNDVSKKSGTKPSTAKSAVAKEAKEVEAAYHKIMSLQEQINKRQVKLLDSKTSQSDVVRLTREIEQLTQKRKDLASEFRTKFSSEQFQGIRQHALALKAAFEEIQRSSAKDLQIKIDSGTFDREIASIEAKFKKLGDTPESIKAKFSDLKNAFSGIKSALANGDLDGARESAAQYAQALSILNGALKGTSNAQTDFEANSRRIASLQDQVSAALKDTSPAAMAYRGKLKEIAQGLKEIEAESPNAAAKIKQLEDSFKDTESSISRLQGAFGKIKGFLKTGMTQLFGISSGFMALRKGVQEIKKMYGEVVKIDSSMINLRKVTDETEDTYDSFLKSASKDAQKLGTTISGLVDQTATWAKLGYTINEAADLSKISTMYEKVGEVSGETAVSDMVTALKAFNLEASDAITVVDRLNELGNNYAVSAADLGDALSRSASALHMAGTSMDQTLAMITGGSEITQKPSEMGNFLKIAVMRIRGMKGELEELGEEVDDSVDSISKVQTQILNLTHGKVNIFDDEGEFRNYYEIMQEISDLWDELSSKERASLSEILFGKVRSNQGFALLQAFQSGQVEKALKTAQNSAGSAAKEYENWMGGLEAKTEQFKAAYQDLAQTVVNSDWAKSIVDSGTQALNMLTTLIDKVGVLPVVLGGGALAMLPKFLSNFGKQYCPAWV